MPIKQSLCMPCFYADDEDLDSFLDFIKETGFAAAEIWHRDNFSKYDEFCEGMQRRGLVIASMCGHNSINSGLNDPSQHQRIEAELIASIDNARDKGVRALICFAGERLQGQTDLDALQASATCLKRVIPHAEKQGILLNLELLNSKVDHFNYVGDHFDWGFHLAELLDSPSFKLLFDIYHLQIMDGDLINKIRRGIHRIGHFHTAGNPGRHDLDEQQEIHYPAICSAIAATNYTGFVGHEFWTQLADKRVALKNAFETCKC